MNVGQTLFAQVMEFVPWKTFGRIIDRHEGALHPDRSTPELPVASSQLILFDI